MRAPESQEGVRNEGRVVDTWRTGAEERGNGGLRGSLARREASKAKDEQTNGKKCWEVVSFQSNRRNSKVVTKGGFFQSKER